MWQTSTELYDFSLQATNHFIFFSSLHTLTRSICETEKASHSCGMKAKPHTQPIFTLGPHIMFLIWNVLKEHQGHFQPLFRDFPMLMTQSLLLMLSKIHKLLWICSLKKTMFLELSSVLQIPVSCVHCIKRHPHIKPNIFFHGTRLDAVDIFIPH